MFRSIVCLVCVIVVGIAGSVNAYEKIKDTDHQMLFVKEGTLAEAKEALQETIADQGLVIDSVSAVGAMLHRTGKDLGATRRVFVDGDVIQFCSARLSRETMEADQTNIVFCPYTIQVYAIPEEPNKVYVGYRKLPLVGNDASKASLEKVNELLETIVSEALTW